MLFLAPILPSAQGNGLAMRAGLFLEALARGRAVDLVVVPAAMVGRPSRPPELVGRLARSCTVLAVEDQDHARRWPVELLSTPAGRRRATEVYPLPSICRRPPPRDLDVLQRRAQRAGGVHVMRSYMAPILDALLETVPRPPVTLDLDELDSQLAAELGGPAEADRFARLERYYLPRVDHLFVASELEADAARGPADGTPVSVVPNAVLPPPEAPGTGSARPFDLLFVGNLGYAPNVAAVQWLCGEVRPLLPGVRIAVIGSTPHRAVRECGALPDVTLAADVDEVDSWYARSRIAVAPLHHGSGTRTKLLEARAHGVPVVATTKGATGLASGEANGVLLADTAESFAATCRWLLGNPRAAERIGAAGRHAGPHRVEVVARLCAHFDAIFARTPRASF